MNMKSLLGTANKWIGKGKDLLSEIYLHHQKIPNKPNHLKKII